jgi:hypothetical protein
MVNLRTGNSEIKCWRGSSRGAEAFFQYRLYSAPKNIVQAKFGAREFVIAPHSTLTNSRRLKKRNE